MNIYDLEEVFGDDNVKVTLDRIEEQSKTLKGADLWASDVECQEIIEEQSKLDGFNASQKQLFWNVINIIHPKTRYHQFLLAKMLVETHRKVDELGGNVVLC